MNGVIYNEDCKDTISRIGKCVDVVLTSPPYNMTKRKGGYADKTKRYDNYNDWKSQEEYISWLSGIIGSLDSCLKNNGVILLNFSYSIENPSLPYLLVADIINNTGFCVADTIIWKKNNSIPHPASYSRLNRIFEFVFVLVRKEEIKTFFCNKKVSRTAPNGQRYYEVVSNFITAKNNDGSCELNKATFSTEFCSKLISLYCPEKGVVYDPFIGTGTTGLAAETLGMSFIGSEISSAQVEYALNRISNETRT